MAKKLLVTLSENLYRAVSIAATHRECSKAEVVRASLYNHLRSFVEKDDERDSDVNLDDYLFPVTLGDTPEIIAEKSKRWEEARRRRMQNKK
jgi:hypothetical protein